MCVDQRKTAVFLCHIITTICSPPWKMQLWRAIPESTAPPTCTQQTSSWRNHGESTQRCPNLAINITASSNVVGPEHLHTDPYIFFINDLPFILLFQVSTKSTTRCIYRVDQKAGSGSSVNQLIEEPKRTFWPSQNIKVSCEFCFMIALMAFHNISYKNQGKCEWLWCGRDLQFCSQGKKGSRNRVTADSSAEDKTHSDPMSLIWASFQRNESSYGQSLAGVCPLLWKGSNLTEN